MDLNLAGKTVIVTGGGSNIGRAISLAFARERANVVIAEVDAAQGQKVVGEAERLGAKALLAPTDVTSWAAVQGMVRTAEERFGGVHVLVNNVGWTRDALFVEKTRDEWDRRSSSTCGG
jgi:NAD(P)-dependent dehydrogenase (short-subunit alcohol dehydrogenase family)